MFYSNSLFYFMFYSICVQTQPPARTFYVTWCPSTVTMFPTRVAPTPRSAASLTSKDFLVGGSAVPGGSPLSQSRMEMYNRGDQSHRNGMRGIYCVSIRNQSLLFYRIYMKQEIVFGLRLTVTNNTWHSNTTKAKLVTKALGPLCKVFLNRWSVL